MVYFLSYTAPDLCEDEGDCDNNMAEDGEGAKLYSNMLSNIIL